MARKLKILLCVNSFKESLDSVAINKLLAEELASHKIQVFPISDGGDGFLGVIRYNKKCHCKFYFIPAPLLDKKIKVEVFFDKKNVYVESANVLGLKLIDIPERNPLKTTSYGLGILLKKVFSEPEFREKKMIIGIGGTSTNDAGCGMAQAIGYQLKDSNEKELKIGGKYLQKLKQILIDENLQIEFRKRQIIAVADVENPLIGSKGSTKIYSKQKGASRKDINVLEMGMKNFSNVVQKAFGKKIKHSKMFGAGGGLAAGLNVFLNADVISWREYFSLSKLENEKFDFIITGEGKIDSQSFDGKAVGEIYQLSRKINSKLILVCGSADEKSIPNKVMKEIHSLIALQKYFKNEEESCRKVTLGIRKASEEIKCAIQGWASLKT
ncbi:MAG: glycerate kinase [Bacteroidetes bacterium]|nr:glycerate kinase [Bacteroidota bacterium]MBU2585110.1 glycerate kinase [Bacteroidota bacterium]